MIKYRNCLNNIDPYVPGKPIDDVRKEFNIKEVIKLASNENPYGTSDCVKKAVIESLNSTQLYPDGNATTLRDELSKYLNVESENLIFGNGTDELISLIGKVFVEKGDECITAQTTFSQYAASVNSMDGVMVYSKMKNFGFDLDDILTKITEKTKIIFLVNPNNPTGTVFYRKQQEEFLAKVPSNILVVIDEAYSEFVEDENFPKTLSYLDKYKNVVLFKTFSKAFALAGFRIGYAVASKEIISLLEKLRNPFNVSIPAQVAAMTAIKDTDFLNKTVSNNTKVKLYMYNEFDKMGLTYIPTFANFVMVDVTVDSMIIFNKLMQKGFIIRPGSAFSMNTYLRVSLGTLGQMQSFIIALKSVLL